MQSLQIHVSTSHNTRYARRNNNESKCFHQLSRVIQCFASHIMTTVSSSPLQSDAITTSCSEGGNDTSRICAYYLILMKLVTYTFNMIKSPKIFLLRIASIKVNYLTKRLIF